MRLFLALLASLALSAAAQPAPPSVWFEAGLAYRETAPGAEGRRRTAEPLARFGVRGVQFLGESAGFYGAFSLRRGLVLDGGGWFSFPPGQEDVFGFKSYIGTGLAFVDGSLGLALSAGLSYELSAQTALVAVYTHRPLLLPELGQDFDLSLGVQITQP